MSQYHDRAASNRFIRSGFTLVELIVVIVVVLTVSGLAISIAAPDNESRRIRETARQVASMLQSARAKAIETGRPAGVLIEPLADGTRASSIQFVEVAESYSGDTLTASRAIVTPASLNLATVTLINADIGWQGLVRVGDQIRFNNQGHRYKIIGPPNVPGQYADLSAGFDIQSIGAPVPTEWGYVNLPGVPYEIIRQPETSAGTPLELPDGIILDLFHSGVGKNGQFATATGPVYVMFSPQGQMALWTPELAGPFVQQSTPSDALYLMIGRNEAAGVLGLPLAEDNLGLIGNYWIAIQKNTGLVTTAENTPPFATGLATEARQKAILTEQVGGN